MSKKVDEEYVYDEEEALEEDRKCSPRLVPSLNPREEWAASRVSEEWTSSTRSKDDSREPGTKLHADKEETKDIARKHEAVAIEEAVLLDQALERERLKAIVAEVAPATDRRRKSFVIGAVMLIVLEIEVAVTTLLALTLPPEPSNGGKHRYFCPNCNLYYPNCSVMYPEWIGNGLCDRFEPYNTEECGWDGGDCIRCNNDGYFGPNCDLDYPNCLVPFPSWIGDSECDGLPFNTEECGWDGGDCCNPGYFGPNCEVTGYPNCSVPIPNWIGDGICDAQEENHSNTTECGWDGGDCLPCNASYFGLNCDLYYPNCSAPFPESKMFGDGSCDDLYNTTECGWEGGDCIPCDASHFGRNCDLYYPNCSVPIPEYIGDGGCDGLPYDVEECGWDGGDCPN